MQPGDDISSGHHARTTPQHAGETSFRPGEQARSAQFDAYSNTYQARRGGRCCRSLFNASQRSNGSRSHSSIPLKHIPEV